MNKSILKISFLAIILTIFSFQAKAQYDISTSNSTSCTFNMTFYDATLNVSNLFSKRSPRHSVITLFHRFTTYHNCIYASSM